MTAPDRLSAAARTAAMRWIADDPHPGDRAEFQQLVGRALGTEQAAVAEVADRLTPLTFGTAGLRGPLRAGPGGMNLATVRRTPPASAAYLSRDGVHGTVVVGYDGRHRSAEFAADAAGVLAAAGFTALLAPGALPTPVTAYAVRALGAVAGVQITASHNPPQDNGIKVYLAGGAQLISPEDRAIEAAIAAARPAVSIDAVRDTGSVARRSARRLHRRRGHRRRHRHPGPRCGSSRPRCTVSAARPWSGRCGPPVSTTSGWSARRPCPTATSPPSRSRTRRSRAPPTCCWRWPSRPARTSRSPTTRTPTGWPSAPASPTAGGCCPATRPVACSAISCSAGLDRTAHPAPLAATTIVSSTLLRSIADAHDVRFAETLTGFKWIVRAGDGAGTGLVFGYEEALGLCVQPDVVRDKDGISAAVVAAKLVATLKAARQRHPRRAGRSRASVRAARQRPAVVPGGGPVRSSPTRCGGCGPNPPTSLIGDPVLESQDLLPATDALVYRTARLRVVVRPSGTEPKLKCYLEIRRDVRRHRLISTRSGSPPGRIWPCCAPS